MECCRAMRLSSLRLGTWTVRGACPRGGGSTAALVCPSIGGMTTGARAVAAPTPKNSRREKLCDRFDGMVASSSDRCPQSGTSSPGFPLSHTKGLRLLPRDGVIAAELEGNAQCSMSGYRPNKARTVGRSITASMRERRDTTDVYRHVRVPRRLPARRYAVLLQAAGARPELPPRLSRAA